MKVVGVDPNEKTYNFDKDKPEDLINSLDDIDVLASIRRIHLKQEI